MYVDTPAEKMDSPPTETSPVSRRQNIAWWLQDHVEPVFLSLLMFLSVGVALGGLIAWSALPCAIGVGGFVLGCFIFWLGELGKP